MTCKFYVTELVSSAPFICHFDHERCIEMVRGFKYLNNKKLAQLLASTPLSPYLKKIYKSLQQHYEH